MASSRACASACASRAPGTESVKGHDAKLDADATAALQKGGVFSGKLTLLAEWEGCQQQAHCSEGGTIGCVFCAPLPPVPWCLSTIGCVFCAAAGVSRSGVSCSSWLCVGSSLAP